MNHNPYSPPQAAVADAPVVGPARPRNVTLAIWLLCAALFMSPLVSVHEAIYTSSGIGIVAGLVTLAIIYVLIIAVAFWVIRAAAKGRRWSRIVIAIVVLLQIVSMVSTIFGGIPMYGAPVRYLELTLLSGVAVLLFTPSANAWFQKRD